MTGFDGDSVEKAFFTDEPNLRISFVSTLGYGDPASIFDRLPRPEFGKFNLFA